MDMENNFFAAKTFWSKRKGKAFKSEKIEGLLMAALPFIGFLLFTAFPLALSLIVSFNDLHSYDFDTMVFVGFDNYVKLFQMPLFQTSVVNTLYFILSVPINIVSQLFLANLLAKPINKRFAGFVRMVLYLPTIIGGVAISLVWNWILEPNYGVFNTVLDSLGLKKIGFTTTKQWFMPSVLLIKWWGAGLNILVLQSALANVDATLKEAAKIDGAGRTRIFFNIVIPQISPMLFYVLITGLIEAFQEMSTMQIISGNGVGPSNSAVTLSYLMYRMAYVNVYTEGFGLASALGIVLGLGIVLFSLFNSWLSKKWVSYD